MGIFLCSGESILWLNYVGINRDIVYSVGCFCGYEFKIFRMYLNMYL